MPGINLFLSPSKHRDDREETGGLAFPCSFLILFLWTGSQGPDPTKGQCLGSVRSGRPIRLNWGPAKFSYGFHITRLVLTSGSFLATIPPSMILRERKCWGSEVRVALAEAARGSRTGKHLPGLCRTPKNGPSRDRLLVFLPRLLVCGMSWPPKDSVMSAFFPEDKLGELGRRTKPISSIWSG